MASRNPLRSYDDATLDALEEALRDVWQVLKAHDPYPDWQEDPEMKRALAEKLMHSRTREYGILRNFGGRPFRAYVSGDLTSERKTRET